MTKEEKCRTTQVGRIVIHLDDKEMRIYEDQLSYYLDLGWIKGYSDKHKKMLSNKAKGRISSTKGIKCPDETKQKIRQTLKEKNKNNPTCGWRSYWKSEHSAWNKGLTKESDKRVAKLASSKLGHKVTEDTRRKLSASHKGKHLSPDKLRIQLSKSYITKKLHNSFNSSSDEELFYTKLLELNKNLTIYRQYKDSRYPFYCDFYIKELDLFIELNIHWTHGGHPYDKDIDKQTLNEWIVKSKTSKFYANAIDVWTIRDVKKRSIAKANNINYIELFTRYDIQNFIDNVY